MDRLVLLIDDDYDERVIYSALIRYFGFRVLEAATGAEGLELAAEYRPDLILLDIRLPDVNGLSVARALRLTRETADIPVLAMSLFDPDPAEVDAAGCSGYLSKPFPPTVLRRALARFFEEVREDESREDGSREDESRNGDPLNGDSRNGPPLATP